MLVKKSPEWEENEAISDRNLSDVADWVARGRAKSSLAAQSNFFKALRKGGNRSDGVVG